MSASPLKRNPILVKASSANKRRYVDVLRVSIKQVHLLTPHLIYSHKQKARREYPCAYLAPMGNP